MPLLNTKYRLLLFFAGTLAMMVVLAMNGATLKTRATPKGIIDLEFAYNASKAAAVIDAWTGTGPADNIYIAKINTRLDFIFIFFYSFFLYQDCQLLAATFTGSFAVTGGILAKGALVAGLLDALENIGMLITLSGTVTDSCTLLTSIFSVTKWILVLSAAGYALTAGSIRVYRKFSNNY